MSQLGVSAGHDEAPLVLCCEGFNKCQADALVASSDNDGLLHKLHLVIQFLKSRIDAGSFEFLCIFLDVELPQLGDLVEKRRLLLLFLVAVECHHGLSSFYGVILVVWIGHAGFPSGASLPLKDVLQLPAFGDQAQSPLLCLDTQKFLIHHSYLGNFVLLSDYEGLGFGRQLVSVLGLGH